MSGVSSHPNYACRRSVIKSVFKGRKIVQSDHLKGQEAQKDKFQGIKCNEIDFSLKKFFEFKFYLNFLIDFKN